MSESDISDIQNINYNLKGGCFYELQSAQDLKIGLYKKLSGIET